MREDDAVDVPCEDAIDLAARRFATAHCDALRPALAGPVVAHHPRDRAGDSRRMRADVDERVETDERPRRAMEEHDLVLEARREVHLIDLSRPRGMWLVAEDVRPRQVRALLLEARASAEQRVGVRGRSEEHTSELQSRRDLVCRL